MPGAAGRRHRKRRYVIRLDGSGAAIVDEIPTGRIASDGKSLLPIRGAVLQQRRRAGVEGRPLHRSLSIAPDRSRRRRRSV
jgi:hypothetical protein